MSLLLKIKATCTTLLRPERPWLLCSSTGGPSSWRPFSSAGGGIVSGSSGKKRARLETRRPQRLKVSKGKTSWWMERHMKDPYVKKAQEEGYASRAAFKLQEMQQKHRFLSRGQRVVDLGAAPGGFSAVAAKCVGREGRVVAVDLLPIDPIPGVDVVLADFMDGACQDEVKRLLGPAGSADVVMTDMAPSFSGDHETDHLQTLTLCLQALDFAVDVRAETFVGKFLMGPDEKELKDEAARHFSSVRAIKPKASRKQSTEVYLLCRGRKE